MTTGVERFRTFDPTTLLWWALAAVLVLLVVHPLARLLIGSLIDLDTGAPTLANFAAAYGRARYLAALGNSLMLGMAVTAVCVAVAVPMAWAVSRTDMPGKGLVWAAILGTFIVPNYLGAVAWILLAGPNAGWLNRVWMGATGAPAGPFNVYSMAGLVLVIAIYSYPYVFVFTRSALDLISSEMDDAATTLGAGVVRRTLRITLPLTLPAILAAFIVAFLEAIALFGVPALIALPGRFQVMTTMLWQFFEFPPKVEVAAAYAMPLLAVAAALLWLQRAILGRRGYATATGREGRARPAAAGWWRWAVLGLSLGYVACAVLLPYGALLMAALSRAWGQAFRPANWTLANFAFVLFEYDPTRSAIVNTLGLAGMTATAAALLTAALAYAVGRRLLRGAGLLGGLASLPLAIPGIVLAMGLFIVYTRPPLVLYGTIWVLFVAYLTKDLPVAYTANRAAVFGVHESLEDAARILGATRWTAFLDVVLPPMRPGLASAWLLVFLPALRELSASILLFTTNSRVVSVVIYELYEEGRWEAVSTLGVLLLGLTLAILVATHRLLGRRLGLA
jgi:iron(III) transport system permease protein